MKARRILILFVVCFCVCGCIKIPSEVTIKGKVVATPMVIAWARWEALSFMINVSENVSPESGLNPLLCFAKPSEGSSCNTLNAAALIESARATETTIELTGKYEGKMFRVKSISAFGYTINFE